MFQPSLIPEDLGVPLMDFAKWVGHLKPGRIVYASPNASSNWDLLLRLNWSEIGGGGFGRERALRDLENAQAFEILWEDSHGGMCFFRRTFPGVWSSSPSTQPRTKRPWSRFHTSRKTIGRSEFLLIFQLNAAFDLDSWCFLFVILILNLCLHTLHTSFSACLTFCIVHLLTDSLCKVVLLIVSPYKKGPWRSGHPTIHMESPLTSFVYSYPLQTTNSPFWKPVTYRHICEASPAHGGKALSHVSPERGRAALVGQTCALAAWAAFLTAWGKGDAFMRCWKWDSMKNGSRVILVHL